MNKLCIKIAQFRRKAVLPDKTCVENLRNSRFVYQFTWLSSGNGAFLLSEKRSNCQDFISVEILRKTPVNVLHNVRNNVVSGIETDFNRSREQLTSSFGVFVNCSLTLSYYCHSKKW